MNAVDCRSVSRIVCLAVLLFSGVVVAQDDDPVLDQKPLSQWLKQLRSENRGLQMRAAQALSKAPANLHAQIIPLVIPVLKSDRENDKFVAAQIIGVYGPLARVAVPDLLPMLNGTQYERNRAATAVALGQILTNAKPDDEVEKVTQALIKVFDDKYSDVRREAVKACGMIGPAAKACIPHLTRRLGDSSIPRPQPWVDNEERLLVERAAAWTMGRMGSLATCHMDLLISVLRGHMGAEVVEAIGRIGCTQDNVVPNIVDTIESSGRLGDSGGFKAKAFEALGRFGDKSLPVLPLVKRMMGMPAHGNEVWTVRIAMVKYLGVVGPPAKELAPEILGQIEIAERCLAENAKDEQARILRDEAVKAYKAATGQEPPAKK